MKLEDKQELKNITRALKDIADDLHMTKTSEMDAMILRQATIIYLTEKRDKQLRE